MQGRFNPTPSFQTQKLTPWVFLLISMGLLVYTCIRAVTLSITHDEVGTYFGYSNNSWLDIVQYKNPTANNHMLNSLLIKVTTSVFGSSEWAIRLPNLLAHVFFLLFSAKLIRRFIRDPWLAISAFVILNVHPYMLDFFGLGRGYGICLMFEMWAVYELLCFWESKRYQNAAFAAMAGGLAVLSNFSSMQFFAALLAVIALAAFTGRNAEGKKARLFLSGIIPLSIAVVTGLLSYGPIIKLMEAKQLYFGGDRNLYRDTLRTLSIGLTYKQDPVPGWMKDVWHIVIVCMVLVLISGILSAILRRKKWPLSPEIPAMLLLILPMIASVVLFYLNGTLYLIYRTSLIYLPMLTVGIALLVMRVAEVKRMLWPARISASAFALLLLVHFALRGNFSHVWEWKYDADSKQMMTDLAPEGEQLKTQLGRHVRLYVQGFWFPSADFYRNTRGENSWLAPIHQVDSLEPLDDFFYLAASDTSRIAEVPHVLLKSYPVSNCHLFRRTEFYQPEKVDSVGSGQP